MNLELENLCRKIAPLDFADEPFYIVLASAAHERHRSDGRGYFGRNLDLVFKEHLQSSGRWRGRGRCFFLNDIKMLESSEQKRQILNLDDEFRDQCFRNNVLGVALHELAHALEAGRSTIEEPDEGRSVEICAGIADWVSNSQKYEDAWSFPWAGHDFRFLKVLINVQARAAELGFETHDNILSANWAYGLSPLALYRLAAGVQDHNMPFSELVKKAPNADFMRLWRADVMAWIDRRSGVKNVVGSVG